MKYISGHCKLYQRITQSTVIGLKSLLDVAHLCGTGRLNMLNMLFSFYYSLFLFFPTQTSGLQCIIIIIIIIFPTL